MGSVETAGGVARSWRGTGWRGARRGAPPPPRFQEDASGSSSELGGGLASASPPSPPGPPDSSWQPGSPQLPRICCLGLFALPQPEPTVLPLKHRVPGAPQSALCAAETHSVVCVCSARGLRATSSPPLHVPPPCQGGSHQLLPAPRAWAAAETRVRRQPLQGLWQVRAQPGRLGTAWEPRALPGSQAAPGPRPAFAVSMHRSRANTTPFCRRDLTSMHVGLWRVLEPVPCRGRGTTARVYRVRYSCVTCVALWRPMLCIHWHV